MSNAAIPSYLEIINTGLVTGFWEKPANPRGNLVERGPFTLSAARRGRICLPRFRPTWTGTMTN